MLGALRELIRPERATGEADQSEGTPAIAVDDLTETFRLYHERPSGLKERLANPLSRSSYTDFDALDGVSFRVQPGESVGVVGHNGSGKSTLLKVLAGILPPDGGEVATEGRVASLLELGAGFHGDLTGRENVYLNGAMLGLPRERISEQLDAIVDFAGVRDFIDQPVRNFSSGMYVRLGFAVAVHVDPDILLVDEVLSVGDASFQEKSLERMASFQQRGKTVMLVSHDLNAIDRLCERVLVLDHGRVVYDGATREGVQLYAQWMGAAPETDHETDHDEPARLGSGDVRITDVTLLDDDAAPASRVLPSTRLTMRVNIEAARPVEACSVGATVEDADGTRLYEVHTTWQGLGVGPLQTGETATVDISFTAHVLAGQYRIRPTVTDATGRTPFDVAAVPAEFNVQPAPGGAGTVDLVAATAVIDGPSLRLEGGAQAR